MANVRSYTFTTGITTAVLPDPSAPSSGTDTIPLNFTRAGKIPLAANQQYITVNFTTSFGSANYAPRLGIVTSGTVLEDIPFFSWTIYNKQSGLFQVKLNSPVPDNTFTLEWAVIGYYNS